VQKNTRKNMYAYLHGTLRNMQRYRQKGWPIYTGGTPNLHSLWLLNSATRTLQWGEVVARWVRGRRSEGGCMMSDAERCNDAIATL